MASLVPCTVCRRHLQRQESRCPFCGAQRTPAAGPFREVVIPRDAARATIFALGLTLMGQACGGKSEGDNDPSPPGAGASIGNGSVGGGNGIGGTGATAGNNGRVDPGILTPPYGGIGRPTPDTGGSAGSTGLPDSGTPPDAGGDDAGSSSDAGSDDAGD